MQRHQHHPILCQTSISSPNCQTLANVSLNCRTLTIRRQCFLCDPTTGGELLLPQPPRSRALLPLFPLVLMSGFDPFGAPAPPVAQQQKPQGGFDPFFSDPNQGQQQQSSGFSDRGNSSGFADFGDMAREIPGAGKAPAPTPAPDPTGLSRDDGFFNFDDSGGSSQQQQGQVQQVRDCRLPPSAPLAASPLWLPSPPLPPRSPIRDH